MSTIAEKEPDFGKMSDEELDAYLRRDSSQGSAPLAGAGAPVAGVAKWEQNLGKDKATPDVPLSEILRQGGVGLGGRLLTYYKGVAGSPEERAQHGEAIRQMREELPYSGLGEGAADMAVTALIPAASGPSLLGRAVNTGVKMAPVGAVAARGQGGSDMDMLRDAGLSATGGAAASTIFDLGGKAINAVRGKWSDPAKEYLYRYNRDKVNRGEPGVEFSVGDLFPESRFRGLEQMGERSPLFSNRSQQLSKQTDQLMASMFDKDGNILAREIGNVKKMVDADNQAMWSPVYTAAQQGTKVSPIGLRNALSDVNTKYPQLFDKIANKQALDTLLRVLGNGKGNQIPPSLSFAEVRELQQSIGPILAQIRNQVNTGAAEKGELAAMDRLYGSIKGDLTRWGSDPKNAPAYKLYSEANEEYKKSFLPFYENDIVQNAMAGMYERTPEKMLSDIMRPANKTQRENLLWYLNRGSHEGTGILETIKAADRAAHRLTVRTPEPTGSVGLTTLMAPKLFAGQLATQRAGSGPFLTPMYGASHEVLPSPLRAGVRGGLGLLPERKARIKKAVTQE